MRNCTRTRDDQDPQNPHKHFPDRAYFRDLYAAWSAEPVLCVEKSRTMMLTWFFAALSLHHAMNHPATTVLYWAQDEDRALKLLDYSAVLWEQQDERLKRIWPLDRPRERQAYDRIALRNGSRLMALPGKDPDKIRSEHPTIVVMDEACFIEHGGEAFDVALAARPLKLIALSSAAPSWFRDLTKPAVAAD